MNSIIRYCQHERIRAKALANIEGYVECKRCKATVHKDTGHWYVDILKSKDLAAFDGYHTPDEMEKHFLGTKGKEQVENPKHYNLMDDISAIDIIQRSLTEEQYKGFCLGNIIKYKLRAGHKGSAETDLKKADYYKELSRRKRDG